MKKTSFILTMVLLSILLILLSGCGVKYCSVSGCPSERSPLGSNYCTLHKCANNSCKNRGSLINTLSYCEECVRRAQ